MVPILTAISGLSVLQGVYIKVWRWSIRFFSPQVSPEDTCRFRMPSNHALRNPLQNKSSGIKTRQKPALHQPISQHQDGGDPDLWDWLLPRLLLPEPVKVMGVSHGERLGQFFTLLFLPPGPRTLLGSFYELKQQLTCWPLWLNSDHRPRPPIQGTSLSKHMNISGDWYLVVLYY